jgi:hypothetical protein
MFISFLTPAKTTIVFLFIKPLGTDIAYSGEK